MIIFWAIVIYTFVDVLSVNSQKISRFLRGKNRAENIIKKIKEGTIVNAPYQIGLSTFDAESIDNLLIELSKEKQLTYDIQMAIAYSQLLYPKNLRTLFNKDSTINLYEDFVLQILGFNYLKQKLTDEQILQIIDRYKNNNKIIAKLLLNQPQSFKIVKDTNDKNLQKILENCQNYLEKPFLLDKYFNAFFNIFKVTLSIVFIIAMFIFNYFALQIKTPIPQDALVFSNMILIFLGIIIFPGMFSNIRRELRNFIENKKFNKIILNSPQNKDISPLNAPPIVGKKQEEKELEG